MSLHHTSETVLAFGELLWDILPTGSILGGAPANFAFRLHTLGQRVLPVSRVGSDELGKLALAQLQAAGVDIALVQRDSEHPTGTVHAALNKGGDATYLINRGAAYDYIELVPELRAAAAASRIICFGTLIQREEKSRATLQGVLKTAPQAIKILDLNLRTDSYSLETVEYSLRQADIVKLNDAEVDITAKLLGFSAPTHREFCTTLSQRYGVTTAIVTRGSNGVYAWSVDGEETSQPGYIVSVADTIGSGDSFTAGFVHTLLRGGDLRECCEAGNRLGALVAGKKGGMCAIGPHEIEHFSLPRRENCAAPRSKTPS